MSAPSLQRILVVDDDEVFLGRLVQAFVDRGLHAAGAGDVDSALLRAREIMPDRIVVDLNMPGKSGLDLIPQVRAMLPEARLVVLTGYGSIATALEAIRLGAFNYVTKPLDADAILKAFEFQGPPAVRDARVTVPSLERVEWEHLQRVLRDCGGNISRAAKALRIHRRSLQRKLSKHPSQ